MIDLFRINAEQSLKNSVFEDFLHQLDARFAAKGHNPKIEPYQLDPNAAFGITPVVAVVSDPSIGPREFYLSYLHAQRWKDLDKAVETILYRLKVT
jgi:hypothetical protein